MPLSVHLHDLRHTFATLALSAGEHYMQVSKWLGHKTLTLTLDTYGDYINQPRRSRARRFGSPGCACQRNRRQRGIAQRAPQRLEVTYEDFTCRTGKLPRYAG